MRNTDAMVFTIVVITHNRKTLLLELLEELSKIKRRDVEVVVVDSESGDGTAEMVKARYCSCELIQLEQNIGAVGRNRGIAVARGKYIVTIDDDILGLNEHALDHLQEMFEKNSAIGAICFRVCDYHSGDVCNWCHPNSPENFADRFFETNEISEGAVAFRREVLAKTGLYPEHFFISHEGADLAARIIDKGHEIYYNPLVCVRHKYSKEARERWRRYYYDTRNDFWLVIRNYRLLFAIKYLLRRIPIMLMYSFRDGYFRFWLKAVRNSLLEFPEMLSQRHPISIEAQQKIRFLSRNRPDMIYYIGKRLRAKQVRI